jgi:hypothetical protein
MENPRRPKSGRGMEDGEWKREPKGIVTPPQSAASPSIGLSHCLRATRGGAASNRQRGARAPRPEMSACARICPVGSAKRKNEPTVRPVWESDAPPLGSRQILSPATGRGGKRTPEIARNEPKLGWICPIRVASYCCSQSYRTRRFPHVWVSGHARRGFVCYCSGTS